MPSTINLFQTLMWTLPHVRYQPLQISGQEPALGHANLVLQTILGPPFKWPWNRAPIYFTCSPGVQDYSVSLADFGFLESGSLIDPSTSRPKELAVQVDLEMDAQSERPAYVSQQLDDGLGNYTFRLSPSPDQAYPVVLTYQKKPQLMTSLGSLWAPVPDELGYVVNHGFLALAALINNDPRFQIFSQRFAAHLLGRQTGLDEMERNIFLANWMQINTMLQSSQMKTQQGIAARQV